MTKIKKGKSKGVGANVTAAEQKLRKWGAKKGVSKTLPAVTFPGSSVKATDSMGANYTAYEKKLFKKTKRPLRKGPR